MVRPTEWCDRAGGSGGRVAVTAVKPRRHETGKKPSRILIVDDDRIILESLAEFLRLDGFEAACADSFVGAVRAMEQEAVDLVLCDINMSGGNGFELLTLVRRRSPETVVVLMTAYGTIESAVEAIKMGAYDYLTKPIHDDELRVCVERALAQQAILRENRALKERLDARYSLDCLVGQDYRMARLLDLVETVAATTATVLIQGESGTGKSLIANVIHQRSGRRDKAFVEVSCGAIPETLLESELFGHVRGAFTGAIANKAGKFKSADGGTIFLDEISAASPGLQVKLLRVLQTRRFEPVGGNRTEEVDVRVVLATNVDLEEATRAGRFREDLYYRINVVNIEAPPLRERVGDIPLLAAHFLERFARKMGREARRIGEEALHVLQRYSWPGNVRELENAMERAVVLCRGSRIEVADLPPRVVTSSEATEDAPNWRPRPLREALAEPEKRIIEAALRANGWNRQLTAEQLDINRTTLYKKMKRYGLDGEPN